MFWISKKIDENLTEELKTHIYSKFSEQTPEIILLINILNIHAKQVYFVIINSTFGE